MAQQGAQWIILRLLLNPCSNPHFYCNWNKQLMTWNLSAVESNPCAKDFKSQKRFFMFLSDLQQSGSTSMYSLGFSICLLTYNLISVDRQTWPFLLTAYLWEEENVGAEKYFHIIWTIVQSLWGCWISDLKGDPRCDIYLQFLRSKWPLYQWSMKRMHAHTYPWIHSLQTLSATVD